MKNRAELANLKEKNGHSRQKEDHVKKARKRIRIRKIQVIKHVLSLESTIIEEVYVRQSYLMTYFLLS